MNSTAAHIGADPQPGAFDGSWRAGGPVQSIVSPIDGEILGSVAIGTGADCDRVVSAAHEAFDQWRAVPAPARAEVVRQLGEALRGHQEELSQLVTREMGKPIREARGEVQEMIDVCDFAVGLGRQIGGLTLPSERAGHRLMEQWHPLGVVGVVTAFNFPVAVWAWNAALAMVCGDTLVWKPSSKTPLTAIAVTEIAREVLERNGHPAAIAGLIIGPGREVGEHLIKDPRVRLVSYTGSVPTGRRVGQVVQERFGRPLLELGGNNAAVVAPSADLDMAAAAIYFGAVGTAGQRCTSTRRVFLHEGVRDGIMSRLERLYAATTIGDPLDEAVVMGPLVDEAAVETMSEALEKALSQGGRLVMGGVRREDLGPAYVTPAIVEVDAPIPMMQEETFAPILYVTTYETMDEAIALHNDVPQGLSSAIFTNDLREAEAFTSALGSDCGIANVNAGTSGAEIGGAFGGEKETGGGRESGSDSWKAYMRRQTTVVNYSGRMELAQGITLDLGGGCTMKTCPFCAEEIQDEAIKCRYCGEFLDGAQGPAAPKSRWYFSNTVLVLAILTVGPLALPLLWLNPRHSMVVRLLVTVAVLIVSAWAYMVAKDLMVDLIEQVELMQELGGA